MPLSHRNHAGWRMVCYLSGMETMFFLLGNKSRSICKEVAGRLCSGQVHEKSAEVLCLASLKGLVRLDEWPVKIFFALPCGMVCCKRSWDEGWFVLFFLEGRPSSKCVFPDLVLPCRGRRLWLRSGYFCLLVGSGFQLCVQNKRPTLADWSRDKNPKRISKK